MTDWQDRKSIASSLLSGDSGDFSREEIAQLFSGCPTVRYKKHDFLFRTGDLVQSVYYIRRGKLVRYMYLPDGKRRILDYHAPGTMIGLSDAFTELPSINDCEVYSDCTLLQSSVDEFYRRLNEVGLMRKFVRMEAQKSQYLRRMVVLVGEQCDIDLVSELLRHGLTQQEIGDFLGVSRVQVARICRKLRESDPPFDDA